VGKKVFLSVVIPCYNEAGNLRRGVLREVREYLEKNPPSLGSSGETRWEVLVSDDGSTDESRELVRKAIKGWEHFKLLENEHGGKPWALWQGINKAGGEYVLFTDMDQSTPIGELSKLLTELKKGVQVVIGSRGVSRKNFPVYRRIGAMAFRGLRQALILPEIKDTQCGFKLFKTEKVKEAFQRLEFFKRDRRDKGWMVTSFDVELLHILKKMGCEIAEVRVEWADRDESTGKGGGVSKYARESQEMLGEMFRVWRNERRGVYG
jgi:dolichyl-phosphate beta-glucosyltransferase